MLWTLVRLVGIALLSGQAAGAQVLFQEGFEGSLGAIRGHFGNATGASTMALSSDRPAASPGRQSLVLRASAGSALLYTRLPQDEPLLYARYFARYAGNAGYHHSGLYLGGYEPPSDWPLGDAGLRGVRPNGDRFLNVGFEPRGGAPQRLDFYMNWIDMPGAPYQGLYYGREMLRSESLPNAAGAWRCIEVMVKLNATSGGRDGELALWLDGALVQHFRPGSPRGSFDAAGNWLTSAAGAPFPGFRWRDTTALGLNWVKLQNYDADHDLSVDDLVVSRTRIGCGARPVCGNRLVEAGEACDDGNRTAGDGCSDSCQVEQCANRVDDDGDGATDLDDFGCTAAWDLSERDPLLACDDGADNDGDGRRDFRIAGGGDVGCRDAGWGNERPQCQDGVDNDRASGIDFDGGASLNGGVPRAAPDPDCHQPWSSWESDACGLGFELVLLAPLGARLARRRR